MRPNLADFFGRADIAPEFAVLEDVARPENDWIEAIFAIVNKTRTR